jgi:hypothetical protein
VTCRVVAGLVLILLGCSQAVAGDIEDFGQVDKLYRGGEFAEALVAANRFIKKHPQSPLLPNAMYTAGRLTGDVASALDLFSQVIVKYPGSSVVDNALFMIAQYHYAAGSFDRASVRFLFIVENYKTSDISDAAHWWLSRAYYALGDTALARVWKGKLAQKHPGSEYTKSAGTLAPEAAPTETHRFTVQVGSFRKKDAATSLGNSLTKKGYSAYITMGESSGNVLYRVRVGSFLTRAEAGEMVKTLKEVEGLSAWVTSRN